MVDLAANEYERLYQAISSLGAAADLSLSLSEDMWLNTVPGDKQSAK